MTSQPDNPTESTPLDHREMKANHQQNHLTEIIHTTTNTIES